MKKFLVIFLLFSLLAIGACCPIDAMSIDCAMNMHIQLAPLKEMTFSFAQILLVLGLVAAIVLSYKRNAYFSKNLLKHRIRDWISQQISALQLLYSILFSKGILNPKLYDVIA